MQCGLTYTDSRRVEHVARDMQALARHGATYVVHMLHEGDLRAYYATLRAIVRVSREAGLGVWLDPVGLGYVFGGDDFLSDFALRHPETAQVDQAGRPLPAACPNQPAFRGFMRDWIDRAIDLGPDVLFWDEPHLALGAWIGEPERWGCRCRLCQSLYRERFGGSMPADGADPRVLAFQSETLLSLLRELLEYAGRHGGRSAVTLLPHEFQGPGSLDWEAVAALPGLHGLGSDPYPFPAFPNQQSHAARWRDMVRGYAERVAALCARYDLESHLWVQGFSVPADDNGYLAQVWDVAAAAGIANVAVWGFEGSRDMSQFACEDPGAAWDKIGHGLRRLRGLQAITSE
jgi:hypothetical protein